MMLKEGVMPLLALFLLTWLGKDALWVDGRACCIWKVREECLREFQLVDAYRSIKQRENEASLAVLPNLLLELDSMSEGTITLSLIEGVLAANFFDCVDSIIKEQLLKSTE